MGKGARLRRQRQDDPRYKDLLREVKKQALRELTADFSVEQTAVILWCLHGTFGFGAERLRRFYDGFWPEWDKLRDYYEVSDSDAQYIAVQKLKEIGVDLYKWKEDSNVDA